MNQPILVISSNCHFVNRQKLDTWVRGAQCFSDPSFYLSCKNPTNIRLKSKWTNYIVAPPINVPTVTKVWNDMADSKHNRSIIATIILLIQPISLRVILCFHKTVASGKIWIFYEKIIKVFPNWWWCIYLEKFTYSCDDWQYKGIFKFSLIPKIYSKTQFKVEYKKISFIQPLEKS